MSAELCIRIQGKNPPSWAIGSKRGRFFSYYENEHGEQWVAKIDKDILYISGLDIDWGEIQLTIEQARAENDRITNQIVVIALMQTKGIDDSVGKAFLETAITNQREHTVKMPLTHLMFEQGELMWLLSVLNVAIQLMK